MGLLTGCATDPDADADTPTTEPTYQSDMWSAFGPFLKPAMFDDEEAIPGPVSIIVPGQGEVWLDASSLLPGEEVEREFYSVTFDEGTPVIAGVVQTRVAVQGEQSELFMTSVIGIRVSANAGESTETTLLTRTNIFKGAQHEASLAGRSDLGVVAVLIEGELLSDQGSMRRLIGVDVVRGTEVWFKEHGTPVYGEGSALWYAGSQEDPGEIGCTENLEGISVASGRVLWGADDAPTADDECLTFSSIGGGYAWAMGSSGVVGIVDTETGQLFYTENDPRFWDPQLSLILTGGDPGSDTDLVVHDVRTSATVYTMAADRVEELDLSVKALFDGYLYASSNEGNLVVDVRTGVQQSDEWEVFPLARVGAHLWMSDGRLVQM